MRSEERQLHWTTWDELNHTTVTVGFENGGWTAEGFISSSDVSFVIRFDDQWLTRQFLLFRDSDEPDLWLATDGAGHWGETNGAPREDLNGCTDIELAGSPFPRSAALRRVLAGHQRDETFIVAVIDVETLDVVPHQQRLTHVVDNQWMRRSLTTGFEVQISVDDFGMIVDEPDRFRRVSTNNGT